MSRSSLLCRPLSLLLGLALFVLLPVGGPARAADKSSKVTFDTVDGVTLQGTFYPSAKGKDEPTVLLLHKIGSDSHKDWDKFAEKLQDKGYSVLSFDFRGHGNSTSIDPMKFWDGRLYPWNRNYIKGGPLDAKGKPKESIGKEGFQSGYYPYLVNDISAAKMFLDERNDAGDCNSQALLLIGAEDGAALGALWMHSEWNRYAAASVISNPRNPALPPLAVRGVDTKEPLGKGQYCAIWLSISTSLGGKMSVSGPVKGALREVAREKKIPMGFLYSEKDELGKEHAKALVSSIKGDSTDDKWKFTLEQAVPSPKLTGSALLGKNLKTEEMILVYLDKLRDKKAPQKWSKMENNGTAYVWVVSGTYRVAKEEKGKAFEPIPMILLGIMP